MNSSKQNLENVKGMPIPIYSESELQELLSKDDFREFLELVGYEDITEGDK